MPAPVYFTTQASPLGDLTLCMTGGRLCGLYFEGHKPVPKHEGWIRDDGPLFDAARTWLGAYFAGKKPRKRLPVDFRSGTSFQRRVWDALISIPYGETTSYAAIAAEIGSPRAVRAVGAAVGRNPLSIFIPCHRVLGRDGTLTGYAGGIDRKKHLLALEAQK